MDEGADVSHHQQKEDVLHNQFAQNKFNYSEENSSSKLRQNEQPFSKYIVPSFINFEQPFNNIGDQQMATSNSAREQQNQDSAEELGHIIQAVYEYYLEQTDFSGLNSEQKAIKEKDLWQDAEVDGLKQYEWILQQKTQEDDERENQKFAASLQQVPQNQNEQYIAASYSQMFPKKSVFKFNNSQQLEGEIPNINKHPPFALNNNKSKLRENNSNLQNSNQILIVDSGEDSLLNDYGFDVDDETLNFKIPKEKPSNLIATYMDKGQYHQSIQSSILHQPQSNGSMIRTELRGNTPSLTKQRGSKKTMDLSSRKKQHMQEEFKDDRKSLRFNSSVDDAVADLILNNPIQDIKKVPVREMASKVKSKQHIYSILVTEGQYYLPPYQECTLEYIQDILSGKKKVQVLQNSEVQIIKVPRLQELSAKQLQSDAYKQRKIRLYLPELSESRQINREFLFNIINTVMPDFFPENIKGALQYRYEQAAEKQNKFVEIAPMFYELLMGSKTLSRNNRGRAVHLLGAGTKRRDKKRKRDQANINMMKQSYNIKGFDQYPQQETNKRFKPNNFHQANTETNKLQDLRGRNMHQETRYNSHDNQFIQNNQISTLSNTFEDKGK